jgi:hypothetical protein
MPYHELQMLCSLTVVVFIAQFFGGCDGMDQSTTPVPHPLRAYPKR